MTNTKNNLFKTALWQLWELTFADIPENQLTKSPEFQKFVETLKEIKNNGYKDEFVSLCNSIMK